MPKVLNFKVIIEQDEKGYFVASVPAVPGCHSQGKTYEDALKNIKEAIELCLEVAETEPAYKARIDFEQMNQGPRLLDIVEIPIRFQFQTA
jgi:predicted RNase H-like HicB family nuclease